MECPGLSLFQGEGLKLDTNRLEEEEALEDQKRRDEELGNELENAFDDLIVEDEYTVDSSSHFHTNVDHHRDSPTSGDERARNVHKVGQFTHHSPQNPKISEEAYNNVLGKIESLKKALESKTRECENITKMVHDEAKKNDDLKKRLAIGEAEVCRLNMTNKQTHELLVESKEKISDLEDTVLTLRNKIKSLEAANNEKIADLERVQTLLSDAQHKYMMVERNLGKNSERHTELILKQTNDRHIAQIDLMQQQIDSLRSKLDGKDAELKTLDTRYRELQRSREALLIDKAETINQLARNLEDSQRQCQELMSKQDYAQENIRLQRLINALENQADDMRKTIDSLQARLTTTTQELELMDSVLCENGDDHGSPRRSSFAKGTVIGSTPMPVGDRLTRLKNELYRSIASRKTKREEIRKLQEQLASRNEEIKILKDDENAALVKITTYKEENIRLENKVRILETELEELQKSKSDSGIEKSARDGIEQEIEKLHKENDLLRQQLKNSRSEFEILKEKSNSLKSEVDHLRERLKTAGNDESERRKLGANITNLNIDLDEMKQEHNSLKANYEALLRENEALKRRNTHESIKLELERQKFLLKDAQNECDRLKNLYVEISNSKEGLALELANLKASDLYRELHAQKEKCINLERALQLMDLKASEYEKLLKAEKAMHDDEIRQLRERMEKDMANGSKSSKSNSFSCSKCIEYAAEVTKFEIQTLKLENQSSLYSKQMADVKEKLEEAKATIEELRDKLTLKDERDKLISELKLKAQQFEQYIKCQGSSATTSGVSSPKQQVESRDQSVETSPELEQNHNKRQIETKIRDEMGRIFAAEIKNIEDRSKLRLQELEQQNIALRQTLQELTSELNVRHNETEILKHAILSERENMEEILKQKDLDAQDLFQKQTNILQKCRDELSAKRNKIAELTRELDERSAQIEAERQSMKAVMNQWEEQRKVNDKKQEDWKKIIEDLKAEHERTVHQLQAKYNSSRKIAANYKRYAEDKEKHMMQEYERIKAEYDAAIKKVENKMKEIVERRNKSMNQRVAEIENNYEAKISSIRRDPLS